jgi:SPP1 family predicted phage head-tail adaptor
MSRDPGKYDRRMVLERSVPGTASATGEVLDTWVEACKLWVERRPITVRELEGASQVQSEATHVLHARYRSDVAPEETWRLRFGSTYYYIESCIDLDDAHEEWEFRVKERK